VIQTQSLVKGVLIKAVAMSTVVIVEIIMEGEERRKGLAQKRQTYQFKLTMSH
jgi:hypothetical protein